MGTMPMATISLKVRVIHLFLRTKSKEIDIDEREAVEEAAVVEIRSVVETVLQRAQWPGAVVGA